MAKVIRISNRPVLLNALHGLNKVPNRFSEPTILKTKQSALYKTKNMGMCFKRIHENKIKI